MGYDDECEKVLNHTNCELVVATICMVRTIDKQSMIFMKVLRKFQKLLYVSFFKNEWRCLRNVCNRLGSIWNEFSNVPPIIYFSFFPILSTFFIGFLLSIIKKTILLDRFNYVTIFLTELILQQKFPSIWYVFLMMF